MFDGQRPSLLGNAGRRCSTRATIFRMSTEADTPPPPPIEDAGPDKAAPFRADDVQAINYFKEAHALLRHQIGKVIVGQDRVIDELLIAIFTRSHALLVGVPGLAKTLLVSTLSQTLHLSFKRIQFTPDLMPSDITGTEVIYQDPTTNVREFRFLKGPHFREHDPGGRNQPHAPQNPGRHARSDAGT